ncbi:MAG: hypothetical protein EBR88_07060 [Betaproteobacteria bacterium]|nr:hypothetical protein [Betaproteobacteria bacterium]
MDHQAALQLLRMIRGEGRTVPVGWLSPVIVTMLAAESVRDSRLREQLYERILLKPEQKSYATNCGLQAVLEGKYVAPSLTGRQGLTYSQLARLSSAPEVEACNRVINNLFYEQLGENGGEFVRLLSKVVGEMHDNVASHARGVGFSSAQRYEKVRGDVIQFAIVDSGIGMLRNVQKVVPGVSADEQAIDWCLQRGNTTAASNGDGWEQRLPEDSLFSPYPARVRTITSDNHHQGLGLWHLQEIVRAAGGNFWVASGAGQCRYLAGAAAPSYDSLGCYWRGVAIEVELPVPRSTPANVHRRAALEGLAERLGL